MKKAFTLIEIAIVLVIIATIIGLSLAANTIFEVSKVSSVASTMISYQSAYNNYKLKYVSIPGDDASAYDHFSTKCASTTTLCNGNGNKKIGDGDEIYKFFRHIWASGFAQEDLNGLATGGPQIKVNLPATTLKGRTFMPYAINKNTFFTSATSVATFTNSAAMSNALVFVRPQANALTTQTSGVSVNGKQAKMIDAKIDDGRPGTGLVISGRGSASSFCTSSTNYKTATYSSGDVNENCKTAYILENKI